MNIAPKMLAAASLGLDQGKLPVTNLTLSSAEIRFTQKSVSRYRYILDATA